MKGRKGDGLGWIESGWIGGLVGGCEGGGGGIVGLCFAVGREGGEATPWLGGVWVHVRPLAEGMC